MSCSSKCVSWRPYLYHRPWVHARAIRMMLLLLLCMPSPIIILYTVFYIDDDNDCCASNITRLGNAPMWRRLLKANPKVVGVRNVPMQASMLVSVPQAKVRVRKQIKNKRKLYKASLVLPDKSEKVLGWFRTRDEATHNANIMKESMKGLWQFDQKPKRKCFRQKTKSRTIVMLKWKWECPRLKI